MSNLARLSDSALQQEIERLGYRGSYTVAERLEALRAEAQRRSGGSSFEFRDRSRYRGRDRSPGRSEE